jgi:hypothetical protein
MKQINLQVLIPLNKLLKFFELPNKLIEKRFNKLLDYDKVRVEFEKNKQNDQNKTTVNFPSRCKQKKTKFLKVIVQNLDLAGYEFEKT